MHSWAPGWRVWGPLRMEVPLEHTCELEGPPPPLRWSHAEPQLALAPTEVRCPWPQLYWGTHSHDTLINHEPFHSEGCVQCL